MNFQQDPLYLTPVSPYNDDEYSHWIEAAIAGAVAVGGTVAGLVNAKKNRDSQRRANSKMQEFEAEQLALATQLQEARIAAAERESLAQQTIVAIESETDTELALIGGGAVAILAVLFVGFKLFIK